MTVVLDTSVVVALAVADEPDHVDVRDWILNQDEKLVTTPLVLAELDHVVERRAGRAVAQAVLQDFRDGAYQLQWWQGALTEALEVLETERRIGIGLVDASLVALAARLGTKRIATLDQRHFRRVSVAGDPFTLLPADA